MDVKPETLENATEGSQWVDDWLQEVQNQPEQTPSQMEALAAEFDIFQPQTPQELQPQGECVEIHAKQPEETISQEEIFDKSAEADRTCNICFRVLKRNKDILRHMRTVHKIETPKSQPTKRKIETPPTLNKKMKMRVCNWCKHCKDLQGKPYCQRCGEQGKECIKCHRPLPQKYFNQSEEKCDACIKKQQTGGAETALQGVLSTTTLKPEQKWDLLKMFSEEEDFFISNIF